MKKFLAAALLCSLAVPAGAQNAITQEGTTVKDAPVMLKGNNRARQGATVNGAASGQIVTTGDSVVGGRCDYSAPTDATDGYYRLCLDAKTGTIKLDGTKLPAQGTLKLEVGGQVYEMPLSAAIVGSDAAVASNAALKLATGATGKRLVRLGFTAVGDGGLATYNWSDANCATPDDGAQVQPGVTGCWVADFSSLRPNPVVWGAKGDGIADDRARVQAAMDAMVGKTLYVGPYSYCIGSPGLVTIRPLTLIGETSSNRYETIANQYGFVACAPNINLLTFTKDSATSSSGSALLNVAFDAGAAGANTSGSAVKFADVQHVSMDNIRITKACIGVDIASANNLVLDGVYVTSDGVDLAAGCGGIRVGHETTLAGTLDVRISNTHVETKGSWGILVEDAGGLWIDKADILGGVNGTIIRPLLANQQVTWLFATSSALSDSTCSTGLIVDTTVPSNKVTGLSFSQTWTSTAGNNGPAGCLGDGVDIGNTGGGTVNGVHFVAHRAYSNGGEGFSIHKGVDNVSVDSSEICANGTEKANVPANSHDGIAIGLDVTKVSLRGNRIGGDCVVAGAWSGLQATGIFLYGNNTDLVITGNDLRGNAAASLGAVTPPTGGNVIRDNLNSDDTITTISAAATLIVPMGTNIAVGGATTTITNISGMWDGRAVNLYMLSAGQNFTSGSGICNSKTTAVFDQVVAYRMPGTNCTYIR